MSWIVQNLWNNRETIRNKTRRHGGIAYNFALAYGSEESYDDDKGGYDDPFIENDEFNDLLVIERAVKELTELGLLSEDDLEILYSSGIGIYNNENRQRKTDSKHFYQVCERIAYYLGGYFTDEGYLNYLKKKYKFTEDQVDTARAFMNSKFKNKILSKGYKKAKEDVKNIKFISAEV